MKIAYIAVGLALCLAAMPAAAQQRDTVPQREREEAVRRLEAAQRELQATLEELRRAQTNEARRRLDEVMQELRRAQAQLRSELHRIETFPGGVAVYTRGRDPQMGVYLDYGQNPQGARIRSVVRDGPAEKGGLRAGDVITRANGTSLTGEHNPATRLVAIKNAMEIGDTLRVEYRRGGETRTANVVLDRLEPEPHLDAESIRIRAVDALRRAQEARISPTGRGFTVSWGFPAGWLDIELISLDEDLGSYFGTSDGLLVVRAPEEETLRLRSGDVILQVDGREPTDQSHLLRILRSYAPGETMELAIMRDKRRQTLSVTVPEREDDAFWRP